MPKPSAEVHFYSPFQRMPRHAHDKASISFVLSGSLMERVLAREQIAGVGSICMKGVAVEHENLVGAGGALILCLRQVCSYFDRLPQEWYWAHGSATSKLSFGLAPEFLSGDLFGTAEEQLNHFVGILADFKAPAERTREPSWTGDLRDWIHANPCSRPSVGALAERYGVHPAYLSRAFKIAYGRSVGHYARRVRALEAASLLERSHEPIANLAYELGFADQSHLNRVFKQEFGISPARYRRILRSARSAGCTFQPELPTDARRAPVSVLNGR